jgi:hypothetical protein
VGRRVARLAHRAVRGREALNALSRGRVAVVWRRAHRVGRARRGRCGLGSAG